MLILLLRHGHKGLSPQNDPDLTPQGFEQSDNLAKQVYLGELPPPTHCWYSDKIRTHQTLNSVINQNKPVVFKKTDLSVRLQKESSTDFRQRIQKFCTQIKQRNNSNETHFICTHYDWIEEALTLIDADKDLNSFEFSNWSPGQYLLFLQESSIWKIQKKGTI